MTTDPLEGEDDYEAEAEYDRIQADIEYEDWLNSLDDDYLDDHLPCGCCACCGCDCYDDPDSYWNSEDDEDDAE